MTVENDVSVEEAREKILDVGMAIGKDLNRSGLQRILLRGYPLY